MSNLFIMKLIVPPVHQLSTRRAPAPRRSQARRAHEQRLLVHVPRGVRPASGGARARRRRTHFSSWGRCLATAAVRGASVRRGRARVAATSVILPATCLRTSASFYARCAAPTRRPCTPCPHARPARARTLTAAPAQHWRVSLCPTSVLKAAHPPCPLVSQAPTRTSSWRMLAPWMGGEGGRRSVPLRLVPRGRLCYD